MELLRRANIYAIFFLLLFLAPSAFSQSTTVSGTITDTPDGQAWFGGTYSFVFRVSPSNPTAQYFWNGLPFSSAQTIAGSLDGSGHYSVSVPSNTSITPAGSTWDLTICSLATAPCLTVQSITITGATQTVAPIPLSIRINLSAPPLNPRAYTDTEVVSGSLGQQYFNVSIPATRVCSAIPCGWTSIGGGGSATAPFTSLSSPFASTGTVRLANNETGICWRNFNNTGDVCLTLNASNALTNLASLPANSLQKYGTGGVLAPTNCLENSSTLNCLDDPHFRGPNLGVDVTVSPFNARAVSTSFIPLTTGTITGGTNALVVASNSPPFLVNDGVALVGAGATNCGTPPAAPTGFAGLASSMTGTGHAVAGATGSTSYSYVVVAISQGGCYTAASPIFTIANGNATLGPTNIPITSCANNAGTVTCTVGSTTGLASGMWTRIGGTQDDGEFGGRHNITVINGTQFTYLSNVSSIYPMFSTTTTGGTLYFWRENHIVLPALPAGTNLYKYAVHRCTGASCAMPANAANYSLVYISYPANLPFIDAAYNTWDDYGSISTVDSSSTPWFIPTTPPATNVNDMLVTRVTNIVGTAFTLADNATNTVGASSCNGGACSLRFDDAPAITACQAASNTASSGGGGACHLPPQVETGAAGVACYITSSYLVVNSILNVGGAVCNSETIEISGTRGALIGTYEDTIHSNIPGFDTQTLLQWTCLGANPCIWRKGAPIRNLSIVTSGPSNTLVFDNSPNMTYTENVHFGVPDGMGIADLVYNGRFGGFYRNTGWTSGQAQVIGAVDTPLYRNINSFQTVFDNVSGSLRGLYFECAPDAPPTGADDCAFYIKIRQGNNWQGPITPLVTVNAFSGGRFGWIYLEHMIQDSGAEPIFVASGAVKASVIINGTNQPGKDPAAPVGGGQPIISGNPINGGFSVLTDAALTSQVIGINHDLVQCPQPQTDGGNYRGCVLPSLNLATASYSGNHTLNASEGIVFETGSGTTITANSALAGQVWDVFNTSGGTIMLAISSGTLSCTGAIGSCTIPANQGAHVACNGTNCSALGLGGGGGGGSPGGTTGALQYNGGGSFFGAFNSPVLAGNYVCGYSLPTNAAGTPTCPLPGVPVNPQAGTTYTIGAANYWNDRGTLITATNSAAQTYAAVNPSTTGFGFSMPYVLWNRGTASGLLTETTSGFKMNNVLNASLSIPINWLAHHWSDGVDLYAAVVPTISAFPACLDAGGNHYNNDANGNIVCGTSASGNGLSGMTAGQIPVAATATSVTSSKALAGSGTGIVTGPVTSVSTDLVDYTGTAGQTADSGVLLANVWRKEVANISAAVNHDFSAATWKIPTAAGFTAGATSMDGYDSTNKNRKTYANNADAIVGAFASAPTTGDCIKGIVASGNVLLADGGGLNCGIQNTTTTNPTTAVAGNTCGSATTLTMTGVTSTMIPLFGAPSDITASTGWGSTGGLVIVAWFTANTLNYKICNQSGASITPGAVAWNVGAR